MSELCNLSATIVSGSEEISHVIKIDGYSSIKRQIKHCECVKSAPFSVGGHNWVVSYYPNGCPNEKLGESISMFLVLDSAMAKDVNVKTRYSLLDKHREPVALHSRTMYEHIFLSKGSDWGFANFMEKAYLEQSTHLIDDSLSIRCNVTVVKDINRFVDVPSSNLHQHLGEVLKRMDGADMTFHVGGGSFSAHRSVLAAWSPVFRAELFGAMKENADSPIKITDVESEVFRSLLHFIYTDSLPHGGDAQSDGATAGHLLVAADKYNIERLKLICEERLCNLIYSDIVMTTLTLAKQHGFHGIKEACFEFLASPSNLNAMMASDGYEHLKNSCPSVVKELDVASCWLS